ncbi:MAG: DUF1553 domain-containing protein [Planctomyces sp.]|nr:DUF1553 domain-containing protein [Planctomyces sp.]
MYKGVRSAWLITSAAACWLSVSLPGLASAAEDPPEFARVADILIRRCLECHSEQDASGELPLTRHAALLSGGDSGPAIVPGDADESYLVQRVRDGDMPPPLKGQDRPLPPEELAILEEWVAAGAKWPKGRVLDPYERTTDVRGGRDFWSLQPVVRPAPPRVTPPGAAANPIDAFILDKLQASGFQPAPEADRATLIRRMYFDFWGLPPTAAEIAAFENDASPTAYEDLVERLLASPLFGERFARGWLDVARFAETSGYERDQEKPGAWRYRQWVIDAANSDMPIDRFVLHQLAGDEIAERNEQSVIATGFLRLGTWNDEPNDPEEYEYERLEDLVNVTCTAFLGMTVKCARCHDHKFDPIPQVDYYKVAATFWPGPIEARKRELLGGPSADELGYDVLGWTDLTASPRPLNVLKKGEPKHPLGAVEPGSPTMAASLVLPVEPPPAGAKTTGRRRQLAEWIIHPENPLTARVFVNRLWQSHFGEGLVRSPDNFGFTGEQPTHPELLDWLADELIQSGWSAKHIHRLIALSRTYRQSSLHPEAEAIAAVDAGNRLWWRAMRRRLDAEQIRDRMLAVSESLDLQVGGPSFRGTVSADALEGLSMKGAAWQPSPPEEQLRRTLYMFSKRSLLPPLLTTFDFSDTTAPCGRRDVSTVAPQALALMNNEFVHEQSMRLADDVLAAAVDRAEQVDQAFLRSLGRNPSAAERAAALQHLESQAARFEARPDEPPASQGRMIFSGLALHFRASEGVEHDAGLVAHWRDLSGFEHDAQQSDPSRRPELIADGLNGHPAIRFDGQRSCLGLTGQVLSSHQFTILAVISDAGGEGHRTLFSNWNGRAGNSVTSVFFGLTAGGAVRLSDDFAGVGRVRRSEIPFLLTGVSREYDAVLLQNTDELARKSTPLAPRNLSTGYVLGQQGNIDGEYWQGDLAELLVYDRALSDSERLAASRLLAERYGLWTEAPPSPKPPARRAMESLCHVLLNSNEFVYVD